MRYHARLGDARLEYLVPLVLRKNYKRTNLPEISICCSSPDASKLLISEYQVAVRYLQSNKVLGGLAFAYGFRDDGVARTPQEHLHYYADMLEAFIETVFTARDGHAVGLKWLRALWSSRCFPDLHSYVEEHSSNDGECTLSLIRCTRLTHITVGIKVCRTSTATLAEPTPAGRENAKGHSDGRRFELICLVCSIHKHWHKLPPL